MLWQGNSSPTWQLGDRLEESGLAVSQYCDTLQALPATQICDTVVMRWLGTQIHSDFDDFCETLYEQGNRKLLANWASAYDTLLEHGRNAPQPRVIERLKGSRKDLWELKAHTHTLQARGFFYFDSTVHRVVFLYLFIKREGKGGKTDYREQIKVAERRKGWIEAGSEVPNAVTYRH